MATSVLSGALSRYPALTADDHRALTEIVARHGGGDVLDDGIGWRPRRLGDAAAGLRRPAVAPKPMLDAALQRGLHLLRRLLPVVHDAG